MAQLDFFPTPGKTTAILALAAAGTSSEVVVLENIIRIVSTQGVNVRFGPAGTNTAANTDMFIPANFPCIFDTSQEYSSICFYNSSGSAANIYVTILARE